MGVNVWREREEGGRERERKEEEGGAERERERGRKKRERMIFVSSIGIGGNRYPVKLLCGLSCGILAPQLS